MEDVLGHEAAVDGERAEHDGVHEHPAHEGGRRALVETSCALILYGLGDAFEGTAETAFAGGLQSDLDRVEGVTDWFALELASGRHGSW